MLKTGTRLFRVLVAALLVSWLGSGCGSAKRSAAAGSPAQIRFAIAQLAEGDVGQSQSLTENGQQLETSCESAGRSAWSCLVSYASPEGVVTTINGSVNLDATTVAMGSIRFSVTGGQAYGFTVQPLQIRRMIRADGTATGQSPDAGPVQLSSSEAKNTAVSTPATLTAALRRVRGSGSGSSSGSGIPATSTGSSSTQSVSQTSSTSSGSVTPPPAADMDGNDPGMRCGHAPGGSDDFQGEVLTVYVRGGVTCTTGLSIMNALGKGHAVDHPGPEGSADSYFEVEGWSCPYGNMGIQVCNLARQRITAYDEAFGAAPPSASSGSN